MWHKGKEFNLTESSRKSLNQIKDSGKVSLWKFPLTRYPVREQEKNQEKGRGGIYMRNSGCETLCLEEVGYETNENKKWH